MTSRNPAEIGTGLLVLVIAGAFLAYAIVHTGRGGSGGYDLHASFDHVDGLNVGSDVRLAGVKIGSVTASSIDPKSFLANITFTVANTLHLPDDSSAEITSDGLLGGKYLSIGPGGSATLLKPGGTVTVTQGSISIEQLLGKFIFNAGTKLDAAKPASTDGGAVAPLADPASSSPPTSQTPAAGK